ncbi:hypothetical protein COCHEDRAFT_1171694 [Bipolaris maydis C5]|uniref:Uncharacterized protein n=1 Tax=Cochliobolus heterostrophus (strain C5 / ATCC 48332 / race O) TaxID=701091 RepID=M2UJ25_COCH5|nr:hypothetical protein COCHEDRAFT_1171694 [Bipolaris maydis C5]
MSVEATALVLDIDNIREEWKRIEEVEIPERGQEGFPYRTHMERRQQEQALYRSELGNLRPTTAGLHLETTPDGVKLQDRFRDMQILDGVFISALESSYDWRTSYDLLGPVKSGIYANFTVSDERETIDEEPAEDSLENDDNITEQPEPSKKRKATGKTKSCTKKKPKNDATEDQTTEHTTAEQQPTTDNRTMLDCPYPAGEFQQPSSKRPLTLSTPLVSTPWCEETPGRREYHVSLLLSPSSAVDSPPHTPIPHPTAASLPASFPNDEVSPIGLAAQRRCAHEPERCRAWWSHAADACWIVESEAAGRRSPVVHPIAEIEGPGEEEFVLPEGARAVYGERVADQYGVMGEAWPRVGVRVPYEPMGWDDVRVGGRRDGGEEEGELCIVWGVLVLQLGHRNPG